MALSLRTWTDSELDTAAIFNAAIRDVLIPQPQIDVDVFAAPASQTNWATAERDVNTATIYKFRQVSSGAQNDAISWDLWLAAGTWAVSLLHSTTNDRGIYSVRLDGSQVGTIDGYASPGAENAISTVAGIIVTTTGKHTLALVMATKNASSSAYKGAIQHVRLRRTDTLPTPRTWASGDRVTGALLNTNVRDLSSAPLIIDLDPFLPPSWGTPTRFIDTSSIYNGFCYGSGAQNEAISWDLALPPGTYRLDLLHCTDNNRGIYSVRLDGSQVGTIDGYAASITRNIASSVTGIVVANNGGKHTLSLVMATKNASSSAYYGAIQQVRLRRTDTAPIPHTWVVNDLADGASMNANVRDLSGPAAIIDLDVFNTPKAQTNWATIEADTNALYQARSVSSGAQNAEIAWDVGLMAGTWAIDLIHSLNTDRGIYSLRLNGSQVGTVDGYAAVPAENAVSSVTGVSVAAGGFYEVKLVMATKNASSSNYKGAIQRIRLRRTDL